MARGADLGFDETFTRSDNRRDIYGLKSAPVNILTLSFPSVIAQWGGVLVA